MLPSMKFYVVSIVAIFTALGVGIYVGFSIDTQDLVTEQQESLVEIVESQFETIMEDNKELQLLNEGLVAESKLRNEYIDESYNFIIPEKLDGKKIALIETNNEYIMSGIGHDLEKAGANVTSLTVMNDLDRDEVKKLTTALIEGVDNTLIQEYIKDDKIDFLGDLNTDLDLIILCGGSISEGSSKVIDIDKSIIDISKEKEIDVIGVEKSTAKNSYINKYKEYGITTIDNIDMKMGKVALILSVDNKVGNYGIKGTSDTILPLY